MTGYPPRRPQVAQRGLLAAALLMLLTVESIFFGRALAAGVFRMVGERAFFRNDHIAAWNLYNRSMAWGGDEERLETDLVELILFGLDQREAGVEIDLPVAPDSSLPLAKALLARRLRDTPHRAYVWSLASDVYGHAAARARRERVLDLAMLSENRRIELSGAEALTIKFLEIATTLEPRSYTYRVMLVDKLLDLGMVSEAADHSRRAMCSYTDLHSHFYLQRQDIPLDLVDAALSGMEDAVREGSLVPRVEILYLAGYLAGLHRLDERATGYFMKALGVDPNHYGSLMAVGLLRHRAKDYTGALEMFRQASAITNEQPWPWYRIGLSLVAVGDTKGAIDAFRKSRELDPGEIMFFHALGHVLETEGKLEDAQRQFVAAAHHNPKSTEAWLALLDFRLRHRDLGSPEGECARLAELRFDPERLRQRCGHPGEPLP